MARAPLSQKFKVFEITGQVSDVTLSVAGGCNIHDKISQHLNLNRESSSPLSYHVVYGHPELDAMYVSLFAPGSKDAPDFDARFDSYYHNAFLTADQQGRNIKGKEFSEVAFQGAPEFMSLHVTVALQ